MFYESLINAAAIKGMIIKQRKSNGCSLLECLNGCKRNKSQIPLKNF